MAATSFYFVPSDGGRESLVTDTSKINIIDNPEKQTELYDRLESANINARVWLSDKGVLVRGSKDDVRNIGNIISSFSIGSGNDNAPDCRMHFKTAAQGPALARPTMKASITGAYRYDHAA